MKEIRVLLASRPRMLSEVIRHLIERQTDMIVVNEVLDPMELLLVLKATRADVVIVTPLAANGEPHICSQLLGAYPLLIIVTQSAKGEAAYLYRLGVNKKRLKDPSPQSIVNVIREAMEAIVN